MMQSDNLPEILLVPWVMAVEPEPPASETPEPVPAAEPVTDRGVPLPFALAAAFVVAIAVVALPAVYFGWFDGAVLFGMLIGAMIATAIAIVAYPAPFPSPTPETFWTWGSEPVGQCTPSRNTLTGRG
jgi:hypothetical protein